jgi:hypothetical protein
MRIDFDDIDIGFVLLKKQLIGLEERSKIQLDVMLVCKQMDGRLVTEGVTGGTFQVQLGNLP